MRSYRYGCPHCRNPFAVEEDAVGRLVACPLCAETVQIPEADSVAGRDVLPRASPHDPRWPPELEPAADADLPGDKAGHPPSSVSPTTSVATGSQRGGPSPDLPDPMAPVAREKVASALPAPDDAPTFADTAEVLVEDRPKTILYKGRTIELRRVSPEERQRRRWRRRIILILICGVVLIYYLLREVGEI